MDQPEITYITHGYGRYTFFLGEDQVADVSRGLRRGTWRIAINRPTGEHVATVETFAFREAGRVIREHLGLAPTPTT